MKPIQTIEVSTGLSEEKVVRFTTLRQIRNYRGTIRVGALARDGIVYFTISKRELISKVQESSDFWSFFEIAYYESLDCLYVDSITGAPDA